MTEVEKFMETLMVLPRKPEWVVFTMDADTIYEGMLEECNKLFGIDMRPHTSWDLDDESAQFMFHIQDYSLTDELDDDEIERLQDTLPFMIDEYWEATEYLTRKYFNVPTWAYLQGRHHDPGTVEVQVGVPSEL